MTLADLNRLDPAGFVARLGAVFEHSPWVAQRAYRNKPFKDIDALHAEMMRCVYEASREEQLALVRAHPELAGAEAKEGTLTVDSSSEQARLGFTRLTKDELTRMAEINRRYRDKFGFPCIVAQRLHATRDSVMAAMLCRLESESVDELKCALEQIGHITRGRLAGIFGEG